MWTQNYDEIPCCETCAHQVTLHDFFKDSECTVEYCECKKYVGEDAEAKK